jgi:hypothetical protein
MGMPIESEPDDGPRIRADILARLGTLEGNLSAMCSGRHMPDGKPIHKGQRGGCKNSITCVCECHDRPRT